MSAALEVSEGIPVDGRIFETPQANLDNQQPRYLTFVGSLIDSLTATDRPWTKGGGIEVSNPCLRFVKNFLRKGRITPLLKDTHDFRPADIVRKWVDGEPTQNGYFQQVVPPDFKIPNLPPARGGGYGNIPSPTGNMVGRIALPGDQINWILNGPANIFETMRRGIVEISSLKGHDYKPVQMDGMYVDPTIWEINRAIFPQYPYIPVLRDDVDRLLDTATQHSLIRPIVDNFTESFIQFRDFANTTIQNTHAKMREIAGSSNGYVPRYTALDLVLLEQLGLARQDREIQRSASVSVPASDPELRDVFKQFLESQAEEKAAHAAWLKSQTPAVDEHTMAVAPISTSAPSIAVESEAIKNDTPEGQEQMAQAMADTEKPGVVEEQKPRRKTYSGASARIEKEIAAEKGE